MAEHAEVHSGTVTADDYPAHAATYQSFVKLIEVWRQQMRERGHDSLIPR